ncbi:hypothetical protein [Paractinoplanes atraurantiacus]|uniref:Uncharacterized protein n=1 Tax=Paractinoplanes atraurantiacus TaxID=1036182 RepID=A0A285K5K6_9ACTN|nr:hypothetical protein [Actinoplanes atraurantiacus]SNY67307.1 hypothetical protein SAMN05421748_13180 [Actinoplanes atraurantiacus]
MYVGDDRFLTTVAFLEGYNSALDARPLQGFQEYTAIRLTGRRTSLHWPAVVAFTVFPTAREAGFDINSMPPDAQLDAIRLLLDLLDDYRTSAEPADRPPAG